MSVKIFLILSFLTFGYSRTEARELIQPIESVRSLGMGGVHIYENDNASNMFLNPASLGFTKGLNLNVFDVNVGLNGLELANSLSASGGMSGFSSLSSMYGTNVWIGANYWLSYAMPYFGVGMYSKTFTTFRLNNPPYPNMDFTLFSDTAYVLGGALPLGPAMAFGINAKKIMRVGGSATIGPDELSSISGSGLTSYFSQSGYAYALDVGFMMQAPVPTTPTLSVTWQDVGDARFVANPGKTAPDHIDDNLMMSLTAHGDIPLLGWAAGFEYRHITDSKEQLGKKLHFGAEASLAFIDIRAGFYQGYTTYGLGLDMWLFQLDLASYSVEKGVYPGQTSDGRIQAAISVNLGFDPDFKLTDFGGKKRKLKQRR